MSEQRRKIFALFATKLDYSIAHAENPVIEMLC